jgi:hypothetical protein
MNQRIFTSANCPTANELFSGAMSSSYCIARTGREYMVAHLAMRKQLEPIDRNRSICRKRTAASKGGFVNVRASTFVLENIG